MITKFLNPRNDLAFKRIFGTEKNKDILIHFLNDIFGRTTNPIESITFLKTSQDPEIASQRTSVVDVMCIDATGSRFIVEMQVNSEVGFEKRAQYYAAKAYIEQREKDIDYEGLKEVIFLAITGFILFPNKTDYLCHHAMVDLKTLERDLKDFSFSFLELPKFKKKKDQLKTLTEKWAFFFKKAQETKEEDLSMIVGHDIIIKRAYEELRSYAWSPEELRAYESIEMKQASEKAVLKAARQEGLEIGEEKGRKEEKRAIAKELYATGMSLVNIEKMTKLTQQELTDLFSSIQQV